MTRKQYPNDHSSTVKNRQCQRTSNNSYERILQNTSYVSSYSAIYADRLNINSNRDSTRHPKSKIEIHDTDSCSSSRSDVKSIRYLTSSNPSKPRADTYEFSARDETTAVTRDVIERRSLSAGNELGPGFGQLKRFHSTRRAERPAPYYVNDSASYGTSTASLSEPFKCDRGHHTRPVVLKEFMKRKETVSSSPCSTSSKSETSDRCSTDFMKDKDISSSISSRSSSSSLLTSTASSLFSTLMELAYDDSYQAHYDKINTSTNTGNDDCIEDKGQISRNQKNTERFKRKNDMSKTIRINDREVYCEPPYRTDNTINTNSNVNNRTQSDSNKQKQEQKQERIRGVESDLINNLSGKIAPLRQYLNKRDTSNSGVVNFEEFFSTMRQLGIQSSKKDLEEIFNGAAENRISKGTVNNYETWEFDVTHSKCKAVNIDLFTERLLKASELNEFKINNSQNSQNNCYNNDDYRVMKNILHATNKQSDPMRLYSHVIHGYGNNEGNGPSAGHFTPQKLKENLKVMGSNLTDTEFNKVLKKVNKGFDGKISLQDFDNLLYDNVRGYESDNNVKRIKSLKNHNRYSKTYQSCDALNNNNQFEFDKIIDSRIGKKDSLKWGKLRSTILEHCENLPEAFKNASNQFNHRGRKKERNNYFKNENKNENQEFRRSRSLGSAVGWGRSLHGTDPFLDYTGLGVTSSGRFYGKEREDREFRIKNTEPFFLPVSKLRDVLSDVGIQLGNDDTERLRDVITRETATTSTPIFKKKNSQVGVSDGTRTNSGILVCDEPSVSLEQFCDIIGIKRNVNPVTSLIELTDPRSVSVDGGVFSRSIITPTRPPHRPSSSLDDCTSDLNFNNNDNDNDNNSSRGEQQLQLLKSQMRDNRLKNFSSTYLSTGDWKANASLSTSLDGSRRRTMDQSFSTHSTDPSKFWELSHAGGMNDLMPSPLPSYRSHPNPTPAPALTNPLSLSLSRSFGAQRPGSHNSSTCVSGVGSPYSKERSEGTRAHVTPPRFNASSPVRPLSPSSLLSIITGERENGTGRSRGDGSRGGSRGRGGTDENTFNSSHCDTYTSGTYTHRRASSAPPRSSNRSSESATSSSGLSSNYALSPSGDSHAFGGSNNGALGGSNNGALGGSNNGYKIPPNGSPSPSPLHVSVDCIATVTSASASTTHSNSHTGDTFSTPCTPGHSRPPTPVSVGAYLSPDRKEPSRSFSLRKSFPERLGFGGPSSVLTGGRDVRTVSSAAPYAVNLPDQ